MDAINFLIKEHNAVRKIMEDIESPNHYFDTRKKMFDDLTRQLLRHEHMEHQVWYPHLRGNKKISEEIKHLLKEEKSAEMAIKQVDKTLSEALWKEKFSKLKRAVEHHAEEEEKDLFPRVKNLLDESELELLGKKMLEFKRKYDA